MSQILSLFMGNNATDLGLAYQYLDCINWFEEEDSINHLSIFDIDKRPRSIYYGHNIKISKALSSFKKKKEIDDDVDLMTMEYLKHVNASHKQICQYDNNFENENEIFTYDVRDKDIEHLADMISDQLEKIDRCDGLQMIVDCENQYGTIGINALQVFEELQGNKSPKNVFQLFNDNHKSIINRVLAYTKYSESSTMVIPLNLNQMVMKTQDILQEYAFYINNITSSYRIDITMEEYCQRLLPQPSNNIFNTIIQIPLDNDKEEDSILNFKNKLQNNPLNQLNIQEKVLMFEPKFESFGESYFLRGFTPIKETQAYGLDIRIIDDIYLVPKCFGYSDTLALHSCIFSNECYKYTLKNYQNLFEQLSVKDFLHYNLEDIQESKYHLGSMIENYGGIENDEQTE